MADASPVGASHGKINFDWAKQKVGPLPLGVWLAIGAVIILYLREKQSGGLGSLVGGGSNVPNQQTDPAGNVGSIDPASGYVYGTPEDVAALSSQNGGTTDSSSGGSTTGGKYADNNTWGIAAINYLVGLGIDATTANEAVQQYLSSQVLTSAQQGDVNLAIQALGAPPSLPGPTGTSTPPVTKPGGGTTKPPPTATKVTAANPVTGLAATSKTKNSVTVKWSKAANANSYHVLCTDMHTKKIASEHDVNATSSTIGGLTAAHSYVVDVWAEPEKGAVGTSAHAHVSFTLPKA